MKSLSDFIHNSEGSYVKNLGDSFCILFWVKSFENPVWLKIVFENPGTGRDGIFKGNFKPDGIFKNFESK